MMGLPEGWVTDLLPRAKALKAIGNAVVPQCARVAWDRLMAEVVR
jgi:hypothetical protein